MFLPSEPGMLLSMLNMKLRDNYSSLEDLCDDMDIDMQELIGKITNAGLYYDRATNQLKEK